MPKAVVAAGPMAGLAAGCVPGRNIRLQIRTAAGPLQAYSRPMKFALVLLSTVLVWATPAQAQRVQSQAELDALLAPIALQPDPVLSEVLLAASRVARGEPWDSAVRSLEAYPDLLARMRESPQWVHDLGVAFIAQEPQVMDTVQDLRRRAQANGYLGSTQQQAVYQQDNAIVVYPRTQYVYVPYYDPYVVYGPWWWPHYRPVYWHPWAPRAVFVAHFHSTPHWHHRRVHHGDRRPVPRHHDRRPEIKRPLNAQPRQYHRVPESQRQPIVQSMPAASAFSQQRRDIPRQVNTIKHGASMQHIPRSSSGGKQQGQRR
jgi:hypothetical protein